MSEVKTNKNWTKYLTFMFVAFIIVVVPSIPLVLEEFKGRSTEPFIDNYPTTMLLGIPLSSLILLIGFLCFRADTKNQCGGSVFCIAQLVGAYIIGVGFLGFYVRNNSQEILSLSFLNISHHIPAITTLSNSLALFFIK